MSNVPLMPGPAAWASRTCPLGLRLVDAATVNWATGLATGSSVVEGLRAVAWPGGRATRRRDDAGTSSLENRSGIHVFHGLPGLQTFEHSPVENPWSPPPEDRPFQIEVTDSQQRFFGCSFTVRAPCRGFAALAGVGSPPWSGLEAIPLFSQPARIVPAGLAVIRAELHDLGGRRPAAWALVEVAYASGGATRVARGLADEQGRLALMFPWPEGPRRNYGASPPANSLAPQQWPLSFSFFYASQSGVPPSVANYEWCLAQPQAVAIPPASPLASWSDQPLTPGAELELGRIDLVSA